MSSPSSVPGDHPAFARCADELRAMRTSLEALGERLSRLIDENSLLRARLEQSETARSDLVAQVEHIVELLAESRRELRALQGKADTAR